LTGKIGAIRSSAWMPVISSIDTVFVVVRRTIGYRRLESLEAAAALAQAAFERGR
jgi:hypothetical protein